MVGSVNGSRVPFPGLADYAATKAAIVGYTKGAAQDLGPKGITVNVVQPGPVDTDMNPASGDFAAVVKPLTALGPLWLARGDRGCDRLPRQSGRVLHHRHGAERRWRLRRVTVR